MTAAVRVPPSAWSTSQSRVRVRSGSAVRSMAARRLRPIRRWISAVRPEGFPCATSPLVAGVGGARQHRVLGGEPPLAAVLLEGGDPVLDAGGDQHAGVAERDQRRAFGELEDAGLDADRAEGVEGRGRRDGGRGSVGLMARIVSGLAKILAARSSVRCPRCVTTARRPGRVRREVAEILADSRRRRARSPTSSMREEENVRIRLVFALLILSAGLESGPGPGVQPSRGAGDHQDAQGGQHRSLHVQQL